MFSTSSRRNGRSILIVAVLLFLACLLPAVAGATYQKIRVPFPPGTDRSELFYHPDLELMGQSDGYVTLLSRPELTQGLIERGFRVEVLVADLEAYYMARQAGLRDYGVWHTYQETIDELNLIHLQYPNITTAPASIGTSGQGRAIWSIKVSDNPNVQEAEPEVLFDGVHHAREIMTVEDILHFTRYLCENYTTDPVINFLVNNRQIWMVPILNVDGFVYNEQIAPNGGGMWRKNRTLDSGSGCYGTDNNRNYTYQWVGGGSSTNPCDETYRGSAPGSERENQAIMQLINTHHFVTWQSYHSVAGMVLFPWGYTTGHTQDDAIFRPTAAVMAQGGGYQTGQPPEILYSVNGGSFDWGYGAQTEHPKIFAFTTEIGGSDFWPQPSEKDGLIAQNLQSNIYLCEIAGVYLQLTSTAINGGNGNGRLDPGEAASMVITVHSPGLITGATNVRATLLCSDPYVTLTDASSVLGDIAAGGTGASTLDPFGVSVDPSCPAGRSVNFTVRLQADSDFSMDLSVPLTIGQAPVLYSDDFEQAGSDWIQDPTHNASTGAFVRIDPVGTNWQPADDTTPAPGVYAWITAQNPNGVDGVDDVDLGIAATHSPVIDLSSCTHARLDMNYFLAEHDTGDDPSGDWARIDVSNDGGATYPVNLVSIGDVTTPKDWRNLKVDLENFLPLTSQMMIRVQASDGTYTTDVIEAGVDDVNIYNMGNGNQSPSAPALISPPDGAGDQPEQPILVVQNATDPEGDPLTYGFRVYSDALLTQLVASVDGVAQGAGGSTSWTVTPALGQGTYYWRAFAADAYSRGLYMNPARFTITIQSGVASGSASASLTSLAAAPNPAQGAVRIQYFTPATANSHLDIFDAAGRKIRSLEGARWTSGWQETLWDGKAENGTRVPAGVYWVRLVLPTETRTVRVVQVR